jgi:hypothetical protein
MVQIERLYADIDLGTGSYLAFYMDFHLGNGSN